MKRGDIRKIEIDGQKVDAEYLGKGMFATAYLYNGLVYLFCKNGDTAKEIYTFAEGVHIPDVDNLGYANDKPNDETRLYAMPFYDKLTAKHKDAWNQAKKLQNLFDSVWFEFVREYCFRYKKLYPFYNEVCQKFEELVEESDLPESLKTAISDLNSAMSNYGSHFIYEFNKINLGVDSEGNLILRDVIADGRAIYEIREKQYKWG